MNVKKINHNSFQDNLLKNYVHQRELDRKIRIIEAIYITALAYTLLLSFKVFLFLFALLLIIMTIVAIIEIPIDHKKIKQNKEFDSKYNSD